MARRDVHPLLMWWEEERRKVENKALEWLNAQMTGLSHLNTSVSFVLRQKRNHRPKPDE